MKGNTNRLDYLLRCNMTTDRYFGEASTKIRMTEINYHLFYPYSTTELEMSQMTPYEYSIRVTKQPLTQSQVESVIDDDTSLIELKEGQCRFNKKHSQYKTHLQVIADVSNPRKPHRIPTVLGYILPKSDVDPEKFYLILLSIFTPYTMEDCKNITVHPITGEHMSWKESWNLYMEILKTNDPHKHKWISDKVRNMNVLRTGKEIQRKERAEQKRLQKEQGIEVTCNPDRPPDGPYDYDEEGGCEQEANFAEFQMHNNNLLDALTRGGALTFRNLPKKTKNEYEKLCKAINHISNVHPSQDIEQETHINNSKYITNKQREEAMQEAETVHKAFVDLVKERRNQLQSAPETNQTSHHCERNVDNIKSPEEIAVQCGLDPDQKAAFITIAEHILQVAYWVKNPTTPMPEQLIFFLGGEGGTGKSAVLKALDILLTTMGLEHTLRKIAPTGVAAGNIGGSTMHSTFRMQRDGKEKKEKSTNTATDQSMRKPATQKISINNELAENFKHVQTVFFDEVSMCGNSMMHTLNCKMKQIKHEDDKPFGGLTMIFAGDFYQLPPVSHDPLFQAPEPTRDKNYTDSNAGFVAFNMITKAVILKTQHRIKDPEYKKVVQNFRHGQQTESDLVYLQDHRIESLQNGPISKLKQDPVIIVKGNALKSYINQTKAVTMARAQKKKLLYCVAHDTFVGAPEVPLDAKINALHMPSAGKQNYTCGLLPLFPGMPVMTKQNEATELGVSNGSTGIIHSIVLDDREEVQFQDTDTPHYLRYHPIAVYIKLDVTPDKNGNVPVRFQLPNLEPNVFPMMCIKKNSYRVNVEYNDNRTKTKYKIRRHQFMFIPAFAITVNSSQGRTLNSAIVHLGDNHTSAEKPYVMLSRLTNGDNLGILGSFDNLSNCTPNQSMIHYMNVNIIPKVEETMKNLNNIEQNIRALQLSVLDFK